MTQLEQNESSEHRTQAFASVLLAAAENGVFAAIKELTKAGADVNSKDTEGDTALILAAQGGHTETVQVRAA